MAAETARALGRLVAATGGSAGVSASASPIVNELTAITERRGYLPQRYSRSWASSSFPYMASFREKNLIVEGFASCKGLLQTWTNRH